MHPLLKALVLSAESHARGGAPAPEREAYLIVLEQEPDDRQLREAAAVVKRREDTDLCVEQVAVRLGDAERH